MTLDEMLDLLDELVTCHSPPGDEKEIDVVIRREFEAAGVEFWADDATNIIARVKGDGVKVMVCAHKDEIGMVVTDVEEDGRLRVENCGGSWPWKYGEGPIDILATDGSIVPGILSFGSVHTCSGPVHELKTSRALTWDLARVFTGLSIDKLAARGVHVGSRAVVARERKGLHRFGDHIASFALDDRMGLTALIAGLRAVAGGVAGNADLYFIATHGEEIGMLGALRAAQVIGPDICIALDTSPVAHGTPVVLDARPVVWYREAVYNDKALCDQLSGLAGDLGFGAQPCAYTASASDAGKIRQYGLVARTACFGFARDNSHGFEFAHGESLVNVTRLLVEYLNQCG